MFVHLMVRSAFSLLYGTRTPAELVKAAKDRGYEAMALTDRNNLYGVHEFIEACGRHGIRPILGVELVQDRDGGSAERGKRRAVILAKEREGFSNICRLVTRRMRSEKDFDMAAEVLRFQEGTAVLTDDAELLEAWSGKRGKTNRVRDLSALVTPFSRNAPSAALRLGLPVAAAGEALHLARKDAAVHKVLRAISGRLALAAVQPEDCLSEDALLFGPEEAARIFSSRPEAVRETERIAERCRYHEIFTGFVFPPYLGGPKGGKTSDGKAAGGKEDLPLRELVLKGAETRYGEVSEGLLSRIDYELRIIEEKGFSEYFLVVADIVKSSPRTCGRGSAAASVVSYCLGITNVDPIRHGLYFERFLNRDRVDPPDIDVDFAWDERDRVIEDAMKRYGEDRCARVCNHVSFRFASALRDTARVYGIPDAEITAFEKRLRREKGFPADTALTKQAGPAADTGGAARPETGGVTFRDRVWSEILLMAQRITGLPRNLSVHSGGLVITPMPIDGYVPIETAAKGVPVVTWEKDGTEAAGLVKMDLLGNRSLAVIRDALRDIEEAGGSAGEGFADPLSDPETKDLLARGGSMGVFYVESPAMRQLQAKSRRGDFESLVIHSSMIRPAANRFINEYVRRLRGEPYEPLHPDLDRVLAETYGILCYQEDVSKTAVVLAGFSNADADGLRKILSKKNKEEKLLRYKESFFAGSAGRGVPEETAEKVWEMILSFEGYSFCKAHSASYAMVSFQSAYLKAHHPAEFMAAVLSNRGGYYTAAAYVGEARRMGLRIDGPDVNKSDYLYRGREGSIRIGFLAVGGLRKETVETLVSERKKRRFADVQDFARRVPLQGEDAEALVSAGALDSVAQGLTRPEQLWSLLAVREAGGAGCGNGQGNLFGGGAALKRRIPEYPLREKRIAEYKRLGFLVEGHVLLLWEPLPRRFRFVRGKDLPRLVGKKVDLIGWPVTSKEILTREGKPMEFLSFEDETAIYETVLFPEAYRRFSSLLDEPRPFLISGCVHDDLGALSVHVAELRPLGRGSPE